MIKKLKPTLILILIIGFISQISAFGVSSPYWTGNPLNIDRGEMKVVELNLQNMVGTEDIMIEGRLITGMEFAKLEETTFNVKKGTSDTIAPLVVKIPRDIEPGIQKIKVEFKSVAKETGGMINVGTGMDVSFNMNISETVVKREINYVLIGGILVGLTIIILIIIKISKRKKEKKRRKKRKK